MSTAQWLSRQPEESSREVSRARMTRWLVALVLLAGTCIAYLPYGLAKVTPTDVRLPLWIAVAAGFGVAALAVRSSDRFRSAWPPLFAFFVASASQLIDWQFSHWLPRLLKVPLESPTGLALDKLESSLLLVGVILLLVLLAGDSLGSVYLKRGKVRWWLPVGIAAFLIFGLIPLTTAQTLFGSGPIALNEIVRVWPWVLIFVLANGFAEELLFRGLLLPRLQPSVGIGPAILVVTTVFTLWHLGANYAASLPIFLAIVFCLGLAWAILTVKTDSLWGAVLFHAGTDIPIAIALLVTL